MFSGGITQIVLQIAWIAGITQIDMACQSFSLLDEVVWENSFVFFWIIVWKISLS